MKRGATRQEAIQDVTRREIHHPCGVLCDCTGWPSAKLALAGVPCTRVSQKQTLSKPLQTARVQTGMQTRKTPAGRALPLTHSWPPAEVRLSQREVTLPQSP